ncbi:hypothetical protein IFM89_036954 [Coptis chinensis]|uniref:Uncharacterized protein n=1 Tax=Coptis chinensis TaxID=261450 RepID=A0A835HJC6_9MAGN|nr:hypothetical protein IFM89_036954 [Coptis chinensis]
MGTEVVSVKVEREFCDEIDHIPLNERLTLLLASGDVQQARKRPKLCLELGNDGFGKKEEDDGSWQGISVLRSTSNMDDINHQNAWKEQSHLLEEQISIVRNDSLGIAKGNSTSMPISLSVDFPSSNNAPNGSDFQASLSPKPGNFLGTQEYGDQILSQEVSTKGESPVRQEPVASDANDVHVSALSTSLVTVKSETLESGLESQYENTMGILPMNNNMMEVKGEIGTWEESYEDIYDDVIDHMDSVETALEEDAPGLLKVLVDKGITVDEIKLYGGDMNSENAFNISSEEDSFGDLEAVVSKLFTQRSALLKFASLNKTNVSRVSYCLACLLSLVEQASSLFMIIYFIEETTTRYLQFLKWPVEWGWCRDLQSFIFVFERHNRIVLERPEYGYATYFFELVNSLSVEWQIKRLVTAMKLTTCSRTTLIENKCLLVGEDLTEGEARVLEEYGWMPNTGLGSMLNYCDRVVHDRKNEADVSEWRSKIGKLLMNGYDGGTIVLSNLPKNFKGYKHSQGPRDRIEALN